MAKRVAIDNETLVRVATKLGYKVRHTADGTPVFFDKCSRCDGEGVVRPWGVCFKCSGACWFSTTTKTVLRYVRRELANEAERAANGGKTNVELELEARAAELQAQRDRNGGLTDAELAVKQAAQAESDRIAAEQAAREAAAQEDLARVAALYPAGERVIFTDARIESTRSGMGSYAPWTMTKMRLPSGITVVYWNRIGSEGEDFSFKATVKNVEINRGEIQIVVQRAKTLATA